MESNYQTRKRYLRRIRIRSKGKWKEIVQEFCIGERAFKRSDLELINERGMKLKCSHFEPIDTQRVCNELPCVIYLHGNCSSRLEDLSYISLLLPSNITVFCLDLSGSGLSDGEYISLGWYEREDVNLVIEFLRKSGTTSTIGLWGRSMGKERISIYFRISHRSFAWRQGSFDCRDGD